MDEEGFATETLRNEDWVRYGAKMMGGETTVEAHEEVLAAIERFTRTKTKAEILEAAFERARDADCTTVIALRTDPYEWTEGGSFWEVGVPEVSDRSEVVAARSEVDAAKAGQRVGW